MTADEFSCHVPRSDGLLDRVREEHPTATQTFHNNRYVFTVNTDKGNKVVATARSHLYHEGFILTIKNKDRLD